MNAEKIEPLFIFNFLLTIEESSTVDSGYLHSLFVRQNYAIKRSMLISEMPNDRVK